MRLSLMGDCAMCSRLVPAFQLETERENQQVAGPFCVQCRTMVTRPRLVRVLIEAAALSFVLVAVGTVVMLLGA